ncbi:PAS domain-containing protein [Mariniblastus sp.]|nr:PAS domain-containing protein [Mariniblastus sp.]
MYETEPALTPSLSPCIAPSHVVGIGASAGGLEALERLFKSIPVDTGMAFVVVQHLSPDFKSLMDELLARWTDMAIHRVTEGMNVCANQIYLIPPKTEISICGRELHLVAKRTDQGLSLPIDIFFKSLANEWGQSAVSIVLSGTGSDGSRGIRDISEADGLVMSQSADSAKFNGMPKSAEETGVVDLVLPPEELGATLARYASLPKGDKLRLVEDGPVQIEESAMEELFRMMHAESGIDFSLYKPATVMRRIERRILLSHCEDFEEYLTLVKANSTELNDLYKDLLIGVTRFFRDQNAFEKLQRDVLPTLLSRLNPGDQFRAWVAGCATGEEVYSLAILVFEQLEELQLHVDVKIFATDVHRASLDFASLGVFPDESLADISDERRRRFFVRTSRGYQLSPEIRSMIVFASHNIIIDAPFTKLDFVSCRNMLIYFRQDVQERVLSLFHFSLKKNGVLFLGPSETLGDLSREFETLDSQWKFYQKKRDVRLKSELIGSTPNHVVARTSSRGLGIHSVRDLRVSGDKELNDAYDTLLNTYIPAGILLDENRQLIHLFGDAVDFVRLKKGRPSKDALDLIIPSLRPAIAGAIQRVARELESVHFGSLPLSDEVDTPSVQLGVQPIVSSDGDLTHFMVTFERVDAIPASSQELDLHEVSSDRMMLLERELRITRENLQSTIEELETSNEELQASNEELVASNEELQSTNEELHSVNEELYTVNGEYQNKISELTELSDDMNHLFENLDVGLLFLDRDLTIRKFTPLIAKRFDLLPRDVGREFSTFSHHLPRAELLEDIRSVIRNRVSFKKEIKTGDEEWFVLRIHPYRSLGKVDGAVLELFDVTELKSSRRELRRTVSRLTTVSQNLESLICIRDMNGKYLHVNEAWAAAFNVSSDQILGKSDHEISIGRTISESLQSAQLKVASQKKEVFVEPFKIDAQKPLICGKAIPLCEEGTGKVDSIAVLLHELDSNMTNQDS